MMTRGSRRSLQVVSITLTLVLATFTGAAADAPIFQGPFQDTGIATIADCGDFKVLDYYEVNWTRKIRVNAVDQSVWLLQHMWGTDTFVNSVTGEAYSMSFANNANVELWPETGGQGTGIGYRLVVPGAGAVFLDIGRMVQDENLDVTFVAGPHDALEGDFEKLCEVMA